MCLTIFFPEIYTQLPILRVWRFWYIISTCNLKLLVQPLKPQSARSLEGNALRNRVECQTQYICHNEGLVQSLTSILLRCPFRIISFRKEGFLEARPFPHHKIIVTMFLIIYFTINTNSNILCFQISRLFASR